MPALTYASHVEKVQAEIEGRAPARSAIAASWARSAFHHGLEPDLRLRQNVLTQSELKREQDRLDLLLSAGINPDEMPQHKRAAVFC